MPWPAPQPAPPVTASSAASRLSAVRIPIREIAIADAPSASASAPSSLAVVSLLPAESGLATMITGDVQTFVDPSANVWVAVSRSSPVVSGTEAENWNSASPPGGTLPPCHDRVATRFVWSRTTCVVKPAESAAPSTTSEAGIVRRSPVRAWSLDSLGDLTVNRASPPGATTSGVSSTWACAVAGTASSTARAMGRAHTRTGTS